MSFRAGIAKVNINPPMGIGIRGYFKTRYAEGILDDLEAIALALEVGGEKSILICLDNCGIEQILCGDYRKAISDATSVPMENILISQTHTHTGPFVKKITDDELIKTYTEFVGKRLVDVAMFALADLCDAKMGFGKGTAPNVAFIRRYIMKDGSVATNPGVNNPDIVRPLGETDESVSVIRFDREGADTIVFVNFGNHPDTVGGCKISADWPGLLRKNVEKILDGTKCIFFNGAQGDVNHVNVRPKDGDFNGMFVDFDDVSRGYAHTQYVARVITGGVLQVFDKVKYVDVDTLKCRQEVIHVPADKPDPEKLPEARRINELHQAGRDNELPYKGMMLTTIVAEAEKMLRLENAPDAYKMTLSAVRIGPVAIIGIPGEPFTGIGVALKKTDCYDMVVPCCATNGYQGYFPMQDAYDEGGYEARSSKFKAGVAELIIEEGKKLLESIKK